MRVALVRGFQSASKLLVAVRSPGNRQQRIKTVSIMSAEKSASVGAGVCFGTAILLLSWFQQDERLNAPSPGAASVMRFWYGPAVDDKTLMNDGSNVGTSMQLVPLHTVAWKARMK